MTTLHHTIEAAMVRAAANWRGGHNTPEGLNGFTDLARLYIETDVQAWIDATAAAAAPQTCGAYSPYDADTKMHPCILLPGHEPIVPNFRTHIDKDGDTW